MISAPITDMAASFANMQLPNSYTKKSSNDASSFGDIISNVQSMQNIDVNDPVAVTDAYNERSKVMADDAINMSNTSDNKSSGLESDKNNSTNSKEANNNVSNQSSDKSSSTSSNKDVKNDVSNDNKDVNKNVNNVNESKALNEAEQENVEGSILNSVAEDLDISVEELEDILANMGLTALDLVNPQNVSALVAEINADGDMMALVTDESLTNLVGTINQDISVDLNEISNELGISFEELMGKIEETVNSISEEGIVNSEMTDDLQIANVGELVSALDSNDELNISQDEKLVVKGDLEIKEDISNNETADNNQAADISQNNASEEANDSRNGDKSSENESKSSNNLNSDTSVYAQVNANNQANFDNVISQQNNETIHMVDTREIISQINEHMKLQMKEGITQLQMQLNPENLGTVNLTLASKESGVTAQLTAQNEAVKAALESQVMVLKQNLEEQGVKVEAVEVTVASHEFERNLDQNNQGNQSQEEEEKRLRKATRKIDVDSYFTDEDIENLDEAEQVTAKMMRADGNSMDYKV